MPSYDMKCEACGNQEVRILRISELNDLSPCPECGGSVKQVIGAPQVIYKGRGWFKTSGDYSKESSKKVTMKEVERFEKTGQAGF